MRRAAAAAAAAPRRFFPPALFYLTSFVYLSPLRRADVALIAWAVAAESAQPAQSALAANPPAFHSLRMEMRRAAPEPGVAERVTLLHCKALLHAVRPPLSCPVSPRVRSPRPAPTRMAAGLACARIACVDESGLLDARGACAVTGK